MHKVVLAVDKLAALLDELTSKTVGLNVTDATTPVRFIDGTMRASSPCWHPPRGRR